MILQRSKPDALEYIRRHECIRRYAALLGHLLKELVPQAKDYETDSELMQARAEHVTLIEAADLIDFALSLRRESMQRLLEERSRGVDNIVEKLERTWPLAGAAK